jgi:hypothetical protein
MGVHDAQLLAAEARVDSEQDGQLDPQEKVKAMGTASKALEGHVKKVREML